MQLSDTAALIGLFAGAWRAAPPPCQLAPHVLERLTPRVLALGAAAIVWWRVHADSTLSAAAATLHDTYRMSVLHSALQESRVAQAFLLLRAAGIEPILGKGWAVARSYPEPALRPFGDVDLYVPPEQVARAQRVLETADGEECVVDLHVGAAELNDRPWDQLLERSQLLSLGSGTVRVFGPEDHLRLLSLHALRHGLRRPLWLCDLGLLLETRKASFDWDYALTGDPRRTEWAVGAWAAARELLGADLGDAPTCAIRRTVPRWVSRAIRRQWARAEPSPQGTRVPLNFTPRRIAAVLSALRVRWPNPIEATIGVGGPMNGLPRLPFQIADSLVRARAFAQRSW